MKPMSASLRADLFHIARPFADRDDSAWEAVWIEPLRDGGVVLVAGDGLDFIVIPDLSGHASRAGALVVPTDMTKRAIDVQRAGGVAVSLRVGDDRAWLEPDAGQMMAQRVERRPRMPDWRALLARHVHVFQKPPFVIEAGMSRLLSDAAYGLARAAGADPEAAHYEPVGALDGASLFIFPAWPDAVALFGATAERSALRASARLSLNPAPWMAPMKPLALVSP